MQFTIQNLQIMALQEILIKTGRAKSGGIGVSVSGVSLNFNKETVAELGLRDHVCFATDDEQPGKLFIYKDGTQKNPLNGEKSKNGKRYVSSIEVCKTAKLVNGEFYPIKIDGIGSMKYIQFDPSATWAEPVKATRGANKLTTEANKATAEEIAKKKAASGTVSGEKPKK